MANQLSVVAYPSDALGGKNCSRTRAEIKAAAAAAGFEYVDYSSLGQLFNKVKALLAPAPHPCLQVLEIFSHGNPSICNGLNDTSVANFGALLKGPPGLNLCDSLSIYLSGCNTGLHDASRPGSWDAAGIYHYHPCVAEELAGAMQFVQGTFEVHVTVFGTVGYKEGSHVGHDISTEQTASGQAQATGYPMYVGARNAKTKQLPNGTWDDSDCYVGYKNWI